MKKIILLLIIIILLTGCNATYDINISKNNIQDTITLKTDSENVDNANKETIDNFMLKLGEWENGHDFYKREIVTTEKETGYQYTYTFNYNEYDAMSQIRKCYETFNLDYQNSIEIKTSNEFLCQNYYPQVNTILINITSEYEISNSNADYVNNNIHTWKINKSNYKNKPINIQINKNKIYTKKDENNKNKLKNILFIIFFIVLLIILFKRRKDIKK